MNAYRTSSSRVLYALHDMARAANNAGVGLKEVVLSEFDYLVLWADLRVDAEQKPPPFVDLDLGLRDPVRVRWSQ